MLVGSIPKIEGALLVKNKVYRDSRGLFTEIAKPHPSIPPIVQSNCSISHKSVLRGLHFQSQFPQGKLVTCLRGLITDVILDLRKDSKTFGNVYSIDLGLHSSFDDESLSLYVPEGCAHGFYVHSEQAIVQYGCTAVYRAEFDSGILWSSNETKVSFKIPTGIQPIVSPKDDAWPTFQEFAY